MSCVEAVSATLSGLEIQYETQEGRGQLQNKLFWSLFTSLSAKDFHNLNALFFLRPGDSAPQPGNQQLVWGISARERI
jgi:hypothetical protein